MYLTYGYSPFWVWDPYLFAIQFFIFHQSKFISFSSKLKNHSLNDGHVPSSTKQLAPLYEFCVSLTHPTIPWNLMHLSHIVLGLCKICYLRLKYHPLWRYMANFITLKGIVKGNQFIECVGYLGTFDVPSTKSLHIHI